MTRTGPAAAFKRRPVRFVATWQKVLIVVGCIPVRFATLWVLGAFDVPGGDVIYLAEGILLIALCARTFRVREEPLIPPRAWWRGTGRPAAGYVFSGLIVASVAAQVGWVVAKYGPAGLVEIFFEILVDVLVAAYFVHSSIRLRTIRRDPNLLPGRRSDW